MSTAGTVTPGADTRNRPALYALAPGHWRDYVTLLHPPYTLWHLSYVVLGAALAPNLHYNRLGATLLAFFLAVGVASHALDEVQGHPLKTRIPNGILYALGGLGMVSAVGLGIAGVIFASPWLIIFIAFGAFIVPAYNLEWFQERFHTGFWFAAAWGAFPFLTSYWVSAERFEASALFGAVAVFTISLAQRALSRRVRTLRRETEYVEGSVGHLDGSVENIDQRFLIAPSEQALMLMALAMVAVSVAALLARG